MDNRKQQPFYINQRVVAVKNKKDGSIVSGRIYIVTGVRQAVCGCWVISVKGVSAKNPYSGCYDHGRFETMFRNHGVMWCHHELFAPYDPPAIEIPAELLKEPVEERSDAPAVLTPDLLTPQPNP